MLITFPRRQPWIFLYQIFQATVTLTNIDQRHFLHCSQEPECDVQILSLVYVHLWEFLVPEAQHEWLASHKEIVARVSRERFPYSAAMYACEFQF